MWKGAAIEALAFGKKKWEAYVGDVGEEPEVTDHLFQLLKGPCPIGKKESKHLLVLMPKEVNGTVFTLNLLEDLMKKPKKGHRSEWPCYPDCVQKAIGDIPIEKSYWVLMPSVITFRGEKGELQLPLCPTWMSQEYQIPNTIETLTGIFSQFVSSGKYIFGKTPIICSEVVSSGFGSFYNSPLRISVGNFGEHGSALFASSFFCDGYGVTPIQRF